jgi:hypothetical protein
MLGDGYYFVVSNMTTWDLNVYNVLNKVGGKNLGKPKLKSNKLNVISLKRVPKWETVLTSSSDPLSLMN